MSVRTDLLTPDHDPTAAAPEGPRARRGRGAAGLFRAAWRWHLYASFLVVPVLLVLSVTGLIYLFRFQVEPLLHADLLRVEQGTVTQPYSVQEAAVLDAYPGASVVAMTEPGAADHSTRFSVASDDGTARDVYVDPYDGVVLGALDPDRTLSGIAVRLHGDLMTGATGDLVLELGACWAVVMALTGYVLFVKGRAARRRRRAAAAPQAHLRSRHGLLGALVGGGLLLLLVTGLPWTGIWGAKAQQLATGGGQSLWSTDPGAASEPVSRLDASVPHAHAVEVPWGLGASEVPPGSGDGTAVVDLDRAVEVAVGEGLRRPVTVAVPDSREGVYSVIGYAFDAPSDERTVHVDPYRAEAVSTYGYDDYPVLAKVVSQGIGLHEGRSLGLVSFWGAALFCLAVITLCVTGPLMWWRRRPRGSSGVGAPRGRMPLVATPALGIGVLALAVFLPVFGVSLVLVLLLDRMLLRRVPTLRRWFSVA